MGWRKWEVTGGGKDGQVKGKMKGRGGWADVRIKGRERR